MKKFFALLLAALLVLSFAACGKTAVSEPNAVSSSQAETPEPPAPSQPEAPSTSVPEEPEAQPTPTPEAYPKPNELSEDNTKNIWTEEEIEYAKSIGFGISDEEAALYAELADTLNQHTQIESDVSFAEEEIAALETALLEAYESSETAHGRWLFAQMCAGLYARYRDYKTAVSYGEMSLDELWANGKWLEEFGQDELYMEMVYNARLFVAGLYVDYGDPQKALECCYSIFGAYNQAEMPIPRSMLIFALETMLSDLQSLLDPSFIAGAEDDLAFSQDNLANMIAESGEGSEDALWAQEFVAEMEAALARAQEAVAIAPELIAMIEADIEEYAA